MKLLKAKHKRQAITYDQMKEFEANEQSTIMGVKEILLYQKDLYTKLLEYEEDDNKKHEIEEKIKEIDSLISQIDDLYKNYNKKTLKSEDKKWK